MSMNTSLLQESDLRELLAMYQNNLGILERQIAHYGGEGDAPLVLLNSRTATQEALLSIQKGLEDLGATITPAQFIRFPEEGTRARRTQMQIMKHLFVKRRPQLSRDVAEALSLDELYTEDNLEMLRLKQYIKVGVQTQQGPFMVSLTPLGRILLEGSLES